MAEINDRNAAEEDANICHSHDFCDANEYMNEAMELHGLRLWDDGIPQMNR